MSTPAAKELAREYARLRHLAFPEQMKAMAASWKRKNPESVRSSTIKWRTNKREDYLSSHRKSSLKQYYANPAGFKKRAKAWRAKRPLVHNELEHRRRAKKRSVSFENCSKRIATLQSERFCRWCCIALSPDNSSIDHVIPLACGGTHTPDNLVAACRSCNSSKSDKLIEEWNWTERQG